MAQLFAAIPAVFAKIGGIGTALKIASAGATLAGGAIAARGQRAQGKAQKQALNFQAAQMEAKGKEEQAASQREALDFKRRKELALSSLQAQSASSGFAATDPTTLQLGEEIAQYGTLQEMMASYGGRSRRAGLEASASGARAQGAAIRQGSRSQAAGTMFGSLFDGFSRFSSIYD